MMFQSLTNLSVFVWFVALQYFRFNDAGRACSGDFLQGDIANPFKKDTPKSKEHYKVASILMVQQGFWFFVFIVMQYSLYFLSKVWSIIIINRLEAEFDEKKAQLEEYGHV